MSATKLQLSDDDADELARSCVALDDALRRNASGFGWISVQRQIAALAILVIKLAVSEAGKVARDG